MQLSRRARAKGAPKRGFITTGRDIIKRETPLALYKGLGAVMTGIVPKMAIRFTSFEAYKKMLADKETGIVSSKATFLAGLAAGVTEAVAVVTPMEVIKIRLQGQYHSMADPLEQVKYRSAPHALYTVLREEGFGALYRGVSLTALRQGKSPNMSEAFMSNLYTACENLKMRCCTDHSSRIKSSSQFHGVYRVQGVATEVPASLREHSTTFLPDDLDWTCLWRNGSIVQCSDRHDQDKITKEPSYARRDCFGQNQNYCRRNV